MRLVDHQVNCTESRYAGYLQTSRLMKRRKAINARLLATSIHPVSVAKTPFNAQVHPFAIQPFASYDESSYQIWPVQHHAPHHNFLIPLLPLTKNGLGISSVSGSHRGASLSRRLNGAAVGISPVSTIPLAPTAGAAL